MAFSRIAVACLLLCVVTQSYAASADRAAAPLTPSAAATPVKEDDLKAEASYGLGYGLPYSYVSYNSYPYHYRGLGYHRYYNNPWYGYGLGYYDNYPYYNNWWY